VTVVAEVRHEDVKFFRQLRCDTKPVVRLAEQAVEQNERLAVAELFEVKLHRGFD
jgi:hypothetical protein